MESLLYKDAGYVRDIETMGSDRGIAETARVCTSLDGSPEQSEKDRRLIRYLMRHHHETPFESAEIQFEMQIPMDVWRQVVRHRTANVNELSSRYAENTLGFNFTSEWRLQSDTIRQGCTSERVLNMGWSDMEETAVENSMKVYRSLIREGVAREQARKLLPLGTFTKVRWKMDLRNLFHFLELRLQSAAQEETREFAEAVGRIVAEKFPVSWEAFQDYRLYSVTFSKQECAVLKWFMDSVPGDFGRDMLGESEFREFHEKLTAIGVKYE